MDQYHFEMSDETAKDNSDQFGMVAKEEISYLDFNVTDEALQLLSISTQQHLIDIFKKAHYFRVDEKFIMSIESSYSRLKKKNKSLNLEEEVKKVLSNWDYYRVFEVAKERDCCGNDYGEPELDYVTCLPSDDLYRAGKLIREKDDKNKEPYPIPACGENTSYFLKKQYQLDNLVRHRYEKEYNPFPKVGEIVQKLMSEDEHLIITKRIPFDGNSPHSNNPLIYQFELKALDGDNEEIILDNLDPCEEYLLDDCYYVKREGEWAFSS